jgi:predicted transposase YdaD
MADHDRTYKLLFSHAPMVRDLLTGFVRGDWLEQLDFGSLEKIGGTYVSDDLRERADDVVWRVRWGEKWVYIYLLLEFQSTVERYMAVRILAYVALLYQDLIRAGQLGGDGTLPPVLPIVLYNGSRRWDATDALEPLFANGPGGLSRYRPQIRYLLIDEKRYSNDELAPLRNLAAALFRLEHARGPEEIQAVVGSLVEWLKSPEQQSLRRAFAIWLARTILGKLPRRGTSPAEAVPVEDLEEVRAMLAERFEEWAEDLKQKWLLEGRQEGRQEGEARLLERQIRKRFGELPAWAAARLEQAAPEQLERWGERLLEAPSLAALFADE